MLHAPLFYMFSILSSLLVSVLLVRGNVYNYSDGFMWELATVV
jgi:hypothetical protein